MDKPTMNQLLAIQGSFARHALGQDLQKMNGQNPELHGKDTPAPAGTSCFAMIHPVNKRLVRLGPLPEKAIARAAQIVTKHGKRVQVFRLVPFGASVPGAVFRECVT